MEPIPIQNLKVKVNVPSVIQPQELELKPLPKHLRYAFLGHSYNLPAITFPSLTRLHEEKLLRF